MANKPEMVLAKIVEGKIGKYYKENCLVEQVFAIDGDYTVGKYVEKVAKELIGFASSVENVVFVSDNIFCDAAFYDEWTDSYREGLAKVDRLVAENCDVVAEFSCGQIIFYKGAELV